jgi:hypothetical protein
VAADDRADRLAESLGKALRNARTNRLLTQAGAADVAGLSQSCWSALERGHGAAASMRVWERAGDAVQSDLRAYLERSSAADAPRDAVHLKNQELLARLSEGGGWTAQAEWSLGGAGVADIVLRRASETALMELWNWFADVGDAFRSWDRKLERIGAGTAGSSLVAGCWVIRATRRNRDLLAAHRTIFAARFPGSGMAWLPALRDPTRPMPKKPALLWVSVDGTRVFAPRATR